MTTVREPFAAGSRTGAISTYPSSVRPTVVKGEPRGTNGWRTVHRTANERTSLEAKHELPLPATTR